MISPTPLLAGTLAAALLPWDAASAMAGSGPFGIARLVRLQRGDALTNGSSFFVHREGIGMGRSAFCGRVDGAGQVPTRRLALCRD